MLILQDHQMIEMDLKNSSNILSISIQFLSTSKKVYREVNRLPKAYVYTLLTYLNSPESNVITYADKLVLCVVVNVTVFAMLSHT